MEVETPLPLEKGLKRGAKNVIDLEGESHQRGKNSRTQRGETKLEDLGERPLSEIGFQLQIGEVKSAPSSPIPAEEELGSLSVFKYYYEQIEEINKKIEENVSTQLEAQSIFGYETILLSPMHLERS